LVPLIFGTYTPLHRSRSDYRVTPLAETLNQYPDPVLLRENKIEYVFFTQSWWASEKTTEAARAILKDSTQFEELFFLQDGNEIRGLYRVIDSWPPGETENP